LREAAILPKSPTSSWGRQTAPGSDLTQCVLDVHMAILRYALRYWQPFPERNREGMDPLVAFRGTYPVPSEPAMRDDFTARVVPDGIWIQCPIPQREGWMMAGLFLEHEGQLALSELRVFPAKGLVRYARERPQVLTVGTQQWSIGPIGVGRGAGEWSRRSKDMAGSPPGGIPRRLLKDVPVGLLVDYVQEWTSALDAKKLPARLNRAILREPARPGRAGRPDYFYAVWAQRYVRSGGRVAKLAKDYGVKYSTLEQWIYEARNRRGLLTETRPGKAGGLLTSKAREFLATEGAQGHRPKRGKR
jgi:hypothetical protein